MTPRATYRLQFHEGFTFADAEGLVEYLDALGVSHVYASPITRAVHGSTHGYDVADATVISPELGGEDGFRSLVAALRARGMGVIVDIVPNHMGVAGSGNGWWQDVLARGEASPFARFFDIDWRDRIMLPVLGEPVAKVLADGHLAIERDGDRFVLTAYGEHRFPIRDEDQAGLAETRTPDAIAALLERQHYRLASWRAADDNLNWRRFFTISELAGLRMEDGAVFDAVHALPLRLYREGLIDGVRVDHVDGLTDPAGYCRTLRAALAAQPRQDGDPGYFVIEKILAHGEPLATDWGVDGTSGYDFMEEVSALLHAPGGAEPLRSFWAEATGRPADFAPEELLARQQMLSWAFEGQLRRTVEAFERLARSTREADGCTGGMLRRAIERLLWVFPVYRTYGTGSAAPASDAAIRAEAWRRVQPHLPPGEAGVAELVLGRLAGERPGDAALAAEAVRRFQQLSAPIAAKAVEDTAFYRYGPLLSRNDVGFEPARFASSIADFHAAMAERAARFPRAMLATATHDHKRGEDVRARLAVLSELPEAWIAFARDVLARAAELQPDIAADDVLMLLQTVFGAWPEGLTAADASGLEAFAGRIVAWQQKSLREAKLRSSWQAPDEDYEGRAEALARALLDPARSASFLEALVALVARTAPAARGATLAQVALHLTVPGVPDLYQGTELADLSLVDPDNRRPVDFAARRAMLDTREPDAKFALVRRLLGLRRDHPALFASGGYRPLAVAGLRAGHLVAFARESEDACLSVIVAIRSAGGLADDGGWQADWWGDTTVALAGGDERVDALLGDGPVWVDLRDRAGMEYRSPGMVPEQQGAST